MKTNILKIGAILASSVLLMTSCENFLNRPSEDSYTALNYYTTDNACLAGVNYLYNSPWYDFQRGFIKVGEVFSGNMYWGSSPYLNFSVNGTDQDLVNMSYSLWSEISHCSTVYNNIKAARGNGPSDAVIDRCLGECLTWKAMAYFYLVRTFGEVPIIHNNSELLESGTYNDSKKVLRDDVYEYITMTLDEAMRLLKGKDLIAGRIDYYSAEALLSKVYLTRAGVSGTLNNAHLEKARDLAQDVMEHSGRNLTEDYAQIWRGSHNTDGESLIAWRWTVGAHWTCQNTLQSDLIMDGFGDQGDLWGGWGGPSTDLMNAFGVITMEGHGADAKVTAFPEPMTNAVANKDVRRKATIMLPGDVYDYFWRDRGGFDVLKFYYDKNYNKAATEEWQGPCGCQNVKHLYGDDADHEAECGFKPARMAYAFHTHILRLSDVYLIYAEAKTRLNDVDQSALDAFNAVHGRAGFEGIGLGDLTVDLILKERRLEFAGEGDYWYDFVRRSYFEPEACIAELTNQYRNNLWNCNVIYKSYYKSKSWATIDVAGDDGNKVSLAYNTEIPVPNVTPAIFTMPFPTEDAALNPNLGSGVAAIHVDVRKEYKY